MKTECTASVPPGTRACNDHSGLGESYWRCECDKDESVMTAAYAGKFCEHESTVFCHGEQNKGTSFCVNGAKCKEKESEDQQHLGCICPAGFEGSHCEYPIKGFSVSDMVSAATSSKSIGSIIGIIFGTFIAVALVLFAKERYVDKPKRDAKRRAGHEVMFAANEMSSRRNNPRGIV
ncbi:MAG: hypothetical protein SGARI_007236 [Bacillariaceae sp.]